MNNLKAWYVDALGLAFAWTLISFITSSSIAIASFGDLINVAVLIVFVQFLFQADPPVYTGSYLRLSYGSLLLTGFAVIAELPELLLVFLSGYVFSLSLVYLLRQIKGA
jgi:hypothetical protein